MNNHITEPAFPCDDFDPSVEVKYAGLSRIDYAMVHIMSGLAASGQYNYDDDSLEQMQQDALALAVAALNMGRNL
jgi:hypothetical protein